VYNNIQFPHHVSEQWIDNQNQFESGTTLTVIMLPEETTQLLMRTCLLLWKGLQWECQAHAW
jgi:hypothetical protein